MRLIGPSQSIFWTNNELEIVYSALGFDFLTRHLQKSNRMVGQYQMGKHSFGHSIITRANNKEIVFFYTTRNKHL